MSDYIIKVENLGKKYRIRHQQDGQRYVAMRDVIAEKFIASLRWHQDCGSLLVSPSLTFTRIGSYGLTGE